MCKGLRKVIKVRRSAIEGDGWAYAYNGDLEGLKVDEEASKNIFWSLDLGIDILMLKMTLNHQNNTIKDFPVKIRRKRGITQVYSYFYLLKNNL